MEQPTEMDAAEQRIEAKQQRIDSWADELGTDIQSLLSIASALQKEISSSKTNTKRVFYQKKFNKVRNEILAQAGMIDKLRSMKSAPSVPETTV